MMALPPGWKIEQRPAEIGWVRTSHTFSLRALVLFVDLHARRNDARAATLWQSLEVYLLHKMTPETLSNFLQTLITEHRPELQGCQVEALQYDVNCRAWEFVVLHGSFPPTAEGERLERVPFFLPIVRESQVPESKGKGQDFLGFVETYFHNFAASLAIPKSLIRDEVDSNGYPAQEPGMKLWPANAPGPSLATLNRENNAPQPCIAKGTLVVDDEPACAAARAGDADSAPECPPPSAADVTDPRHWPDPAEAARRVGSEMGAKVARQIEEKVWLKLGGPTEFADPRIPAEGAPPTQAATSWREKPPLL